MPKYFLDVQVSTVTGSQTFSVKARNLKAAGKKFLANESMTLEREELDVEDLTDIVEGDLVDIYQEFPD